jgi:hypothetical protein
MKLALSDLWRTRGTIDRGPYLVWGALLFVLKHNIDRVVASVGFGRAFTPLNYLVAGEGGGVRALGRSDAAFYAALLAVALPFVWTGVALTLRRLRAAALPTWLVVLFFAPALNLVFFLALAAVPSRLGEEGPGAREEEEGSRGALDRLVPRSAAGAAVAAIALTVPPFAGAAALGAAGLGQYGWGLFVALPFCLGLSAVLVYGYHEPRGAMGALGVATLAVLLLGLALFAFAIEGVICIAMAAPIGWVLALLGGGVGYAIQQRPVRAREARALLLALFASAPVLLGAERVAPLDPPLFAVRTAVEVDAPPERVFANVVAFSELPPPEDLLFRTGIAYPMRAEISGAGPGAVRRCVFSTGAFVEPIDVWDAPRRLHFSVAAQPPAMREWTLFAGPRPPHLDDYLVSQAGEFRLTPLPGGRTRLEGTTWYRDRIYPAAYWRVFSDAIIHRIHRRVLEHVKRLSERG